MLNPCQMIQCMHCPDSACLLSLSVYYNLYGLSLSLSLSEWSNLSEAGRQNIRQGCKWFPMTNAQKSKLQKIRFYLVFDPDWNWTSSSRWSHRHLLWKLKNNNLRLVIGSKCRYEKNRYADAIVEAISLSTSFILLIALHISVMCLC